MKPIILAAFIVSMLLAYAGNDLLGAVQANGKFKAKPQQGNSNGKKPNSKNSNGKKNQNSNKQKTPEQRFREQQAKALEQQRKQAAEQKRKQAEAAAQRSKELQADKKRRNGLRLAGFKKDLQKTASSITAMERRLQPIKRKHKGLSEAISLLTSKAEGEGVPQVKTQLERMKRELNAHSEATSGFAQELASVKSGNGGKESAPSSTALSKLEDSTLQIKRDCSRVEFELKKVEAYHKTTTKTLFFCVSELVRAGISFTSEEQGSIRALSD